MAVTLEVNYAKKLGLPEYSSHQYSITLKVELTDLAQLEKASSELYSRLQAAVDEEITKSGYVPGKPVSSANSPSSPQREQVETKLGGEDAWKCSDKQRDLILKIVDEHNLDKSEVDVLARQRYGVGVKQLNKLQASGLIDELIETHGGTGNGRNRGNGQGERRGGYSRSYAGRGRQ